jgi:hypothetical protein
VEHIARQKIHRNEHEKKIHKLNHHEPQDLIATPWQIWERADVDEYIEPGCTEDTGNQVGEEEREEEQVWIDIARSNHNRARKTSRKVRQRRTSRRR